MKHVNFKRLTIKNFLSIGEEPVEISFPSGLNIITGFNKDKADRRNGVGKSTIADGIYFSIYGSTIRDIKKENIPNNMTSGKTEVSIEFDVQHDGINTEYKITRLLNPSKCYIYKNDVDITRDSINNTTKFVSDLISSSPEVFQNCIIMTVNNTIPFMAKKKIEKRKFIEGILNLEVFSNMLTRVRNEYNDIQREFNVECGRYEGVSNQIQSIESQKQAQEIETQKKLDNLTSRKNSNLKEISTLKSKSQIVIDKSISEYNGMIDTYKAALVECNQKIGSSNDKMTVLLTNNKHIEKTIKTMGAESATCPMCLQPISDHTKDKIEEEKEKLSTQIVDNNTRVDELMKNRTKAESLRRTLENGIENVQKKINDQTIKLKEKDGILSRLNQLEEWNNEIIQDISSVQNQTDVFDTMMNNLTTQLNSIQKEINSQKSNINLLDVVKFVVSEEGVKSYIVKKILQLLNNKLAYYLKKMDSNCVCIFNEYFEEQIIDDKGKVLSYFNFSGAEKKNIDLACLFAFMDIRRLQGDVAFNFNIYDELFDSSLDEKGVELVIDILTERIEKFNECIMVISHRKESAKLATQDVIFLEKKNGITTRVTAPVEV